MGDDSFCRFCYGCSLFYKSDCYCKLGKALVCALSVCAKNVRKEYRVCKTVSNSIFTAEGMRYGVNVTNVALCKCRSCKIRRAEHIGASLKILAVYVCALEILEDQLYRLGCGGLCTLCL